MSRIGERIKKARTERGLSQQALADMLGLSRNAVSMWEIGKASPSSDNLAELAVNLGVDYEWIATDRRTSEYLSRGLPYHGAVAAGVWSEVPENQEMKTKRVPVAPVEDYPSAAQFALKISGNSVNQIAPDGTTVVCVDLMEAGIEPRAGDLVVVERRRAELVETTIRRLEAARGGSFILIPVSDDPGHQKPVRLDERGTDEVRIKAIVAYIVLPVPRGR